MNLKVVCLQSNDLRKPGSWPQLTSEFWRCSLSMNHPSPGLRPPSPRLAGRGQGEGCQSGSWSQCIRENERGLPMNRPRTVLQITQPHLTASPLHFREPSADRIQRRDHANPNQIDDRQTVAVTRGYRRRTVALWICKKPFRMAITDASKQDGQPMNQRNVTQIIKQRNAATKQDRFEPPWRSAVV